MTRVAAVWATLAALAAGCGDEPNERPPAHLQPVVGCETFDPSPCDVFATSCQTKLMNLAACLRGSAPQPVPTISRLTEGEYAQMLTDEIAADPPPANLNHYEAALVMLNLAAPGAFQPASMAAVQTARLAGVYRSDHDDIVLIDRGKPADDGDVNAVLLHEFVHALQDRDQDLPTWYDGHTDTYDAALAAMSVVEGEARLHQERYAASLLGVDPASVDLSKHFDNAARLAASWVRAQPSPYLASYTAFPYEYGGRRLLPLFMQNGPQAIADSFAAPPADTRTLFDPGDSAAPAAWTAPAAPTPPAEWTLTQQETLGAWSLYLVLAHNLAIDEANSQARGWIGDRLWVYGGSGASSSSSVMVWRIAFADDASATAAAASLLVQFGTRLERSGTEVVIASSDATIPLDWAFAAPSQKAPASADDAAFAVTSSAADWVKRIFLRAR